MAVQTTTPSVMPSVSPANRQPRMSMTASPLRSSAPGPRTGSPLPLEQVRKKRLLALFLACFCPVFAQKTTPAHWTLSSPQQRVAPGSEVLLELQLELDSGWHMYSVTTPK